jgi:lysine N6-hydroxylase
VENDLIGVGAGPANLSLAALIADARERGLTRLTSTFFEKNPAVYWHSGQMFPGTSMQTEFYRDLVTPVDPTSRFSFLNYVRVKGRLDQFLCSSNLYPTRREFEDYFNWIASQITDIVFATSINSVDYDEKANLFVVQAEDHASKQKRHEAKNIVLGCGAAPDATLKRRQNARVVDVSGLLEYEFPEPLRRVLVIGGGQSGAECVNYLLDRFGNSEVEIFWFTSETAFRALDIGNFSREIYSVSYPAAFSALSASLREKVNLDNVSVAHGITPIFAQALYKRLYFCKYLRSPGMASVHMQANTEILEIKDEAEAAMVSTRGHSTGQTSKDAFDSVILCTGFEDKSVLDSVLIGPQLRRRLSKSEKRNGYAIAWDGPADRRIFLQSQNTKTHGLGDTNFITAPGRNASILNAIAGKEIYQIVANDMLVALSS